MTPTPLTDADIRRRLDSLAKPPGSLGRLEALAARLCAIQGTLAPRTRPRRLVLFAADHGVHAEGVSAWPAEVTALMVASIAGGGAASSVLAESAGCELRVVDAGTLGPELPVSARYRCPKVRAGSRNLAREPALTPGEFRRCLELGAGEADAAHAAGCGIVIGGEMGVANSTAASCLTALVCGADPASVVGRGAGSDDATCARKLAVVTAAVSRLGPLDRADPAAQLAAVCGLEIAALAGFHARAAELGMVVLLDGFIATAGLLVAHALDPGVTASVVAAHRSAEPGHALALKYLGLEPLLTGWELRLGEGTGALLALPLLDAAAAVVGRMATLADLGAGARP